SGSISANINSPTTGSISMGNGNIAATQTVEIVSGSTIVMPSSITADTLIVTAPGTITLGGPITTQHNMVFAAGGDVNDFSNATLNAQNGGNVVMAAGAAYNASTKGLTINQLLVTGGSFSGGDINLGNDFLDAT